MSRIVSDFAPILPILGSFLHFRPYFHSIDFSFAKNNFSSICWNKQHAAIWCDCGVGQFRPDKRSPSTSKGSVCCIFFLFLDWWVGVAFFPISVTFFLVHTSFVQYTNVQSRRSWCIKLFFVFNRFVSIFFYNKLPSTHPSIFVVSYNRSTLLPLPLTRFFHCWSPPHPAVVFYRTLPNFSFFSRNPILFLFSRAVQAYYLFISICLLFFIFFDIIILCFKKFK